MQSGGNSRSEGRLRFGTELGLFTILFFDFGIGMGSSTTMMLCYYHLHPFCANLEKHSKTLGLHPHEDRPQT
jgi:hypothetical protein